MNGHVVVLIVAVVGLVTVCVFMFLMVRASRNLRISAENLQHAAEDYRDSMDDLNTFLFRSVNGEHTVEEEP